jgi:hypothetical protein
MGCDQAPCWRSISLGRNDGQKPRRCRCWRRRGSRRHALAHSLAPSYHRTLPPPERGRCGRAGPLFRRLAYRGLFKHLAAPRIRPEQPRRPRPGDDAPALAPVFDSARRAARGGRGGRRRRLRVGTSVRMCCWHPSLALASSSAARPPHAASFAVTAAAFAARDRWVPHPSLIPTLTLTRYACCRAYSGWTAEELLPRLRRALDEGPWRSMVKVAPRQCISSVPRPPWPLLLHCRRFHRL